MPSKDYFDIMLPVKDEQKVVDLLSTYPELTYEFVNTTVGLRVRITGETTLEIIETIKRELLEE